MVRCFNRIEIIANSTVCMMMQLRLLLEPAMIIVLFCRCPEWENEM
jgi:hypothetical protein